jgi:hypothetical protein
VLNHSLLQIWAEADNRNLSIEQAAYLIVGHFPNVATPWFGSNLFRSFQNVLHEILQVLLDSNVECGNRFFWFLSGIFQPVRFVAWSKQGGGVAILLLPLIGVILLRVLAFLFVQVLVFLWVFWLLVSSLGNCRLTCG